MALSLGSGPFGKHSTGTFNFDTSVLKPHTIYLEDSPKRVRTVFNGETVTGTRPLPADRQPPGQANERDRAPARLLLPGGGHPRGPTGTDHTTYCPFKGDASYRTVRVGYRVVENAVWTYPEPEENFAPLVGCAAFYAGKMDT